MSTGVKLLFPLIFLAGCTISTPLRGPVLKARQGPVIVAVTHALLHPGAKRKLFYAYSQDLLKKMPDQQGHLASSIRRKILGDEAWTLTVWDSQESLKKFSHSREHLNALYMSLEAIREMRQIIYTAQDDETINWEGALKKLEPVSLKRVPIR